MQLLDRTFPTPEENLACDEALLAMSEDDLAPGILRFWEPRGYFVVVGYSNKVDTEVNRNSCRTAGIPILRRCSGGGTVLQGPGCLNYSLIVRIGNAEQYQSISKTNCFIMTRHKDALRTTLNQAVEIEGHTDLAIAGMKFSGNSQRRGRRFILFHGTFLLQFNVALVEQFLPPPSRAPAYREGRRHSEFMMNLQAPVESIKRMLTKVWGVEQTMASVPRDRIQQLAKEKYALGAWNGKF